MKPTYQELERQLERVELLLKHRNDDVDALKLRIKELEAEAEGLTARRIRNRNEEE